MKSLIPLLAVAIVAGCSTTRQNARSEIELDIDRLAATGKLSIKSPKDVDLEGIKVVKKDGNYSVTIDKYRAVVSASAMESARAEVEARKATYADLIEMMRFLADKAAASQGVQSTAPAARSTPTIIAIPPGWRIVPITDEHSAESP